jgi:hypothetical protein
MTVVHTYSCLCNEHKCSFDKSEQLHVVKEIVAYLNCSQHDVTGSKKSLQVQMYNPLVCRRYI